MSSTKVLVAAVLGAIAMFLWTAVAHMATPLGRVGIREIPNEQAVLAQMQATIGAQRGFYFFPRMGVPPDAPSEQQRAAMNNYQAILDKNPSGILIYKPAGEKMMTGGQLGAEFGMQFLETLFLAILITMAGVRSVGASVGVGTLVGLIAAISTNGSYWNWYGFPANYTFAAMFVELLKYVIAGIVIGLVAKKGISRSNAASA